MAEVNLIKFVGDNLFLVGVALVSGAMLVWPAVRRAGGSASVSTLQATLLMNQQNALVLDVREAAEYEKAHVLGARNIPLGELEARSAELEKIHVDLDPRRREEMMDRTGRRTVPQIYIGERHVGGFDELAALEHAGKLDSLLAA